jgi:hypothetical protein
MAKLVGVPRLAQPACLLYVMLATVLAHDVMVLRLYTLFRGKERVGGLRGARNKTCLCFQKKKKKKKKNGGDRVVI